MQRWWSKAKKAEEKNCNAFKLYILSGETKTKHREKQQQGPASRSSKSEGSSGPDTGLKTALVGCSVTVHILLADYRLHFSWRV